MKFIKNSIPSFLYGFSFCLIIVFCLQQGVLFSSKNKSQDSLEKKLSFQKIEDMYNLILDTYYEPVDTAELLNSMLETMLNNVDFHTTYIPYQDHLRQSEEMSGNFYGIGIQFSLFKDTIVVVRVLPDGPAQSTALLAGDRITHVDGKEITGPAGTCASFNSHILHRANLPKQGYRYCMHLSFLLPGIDHKHDKYSINHL